MMQHACHTNISIPCCQTIAHPQELLPLLLMHHQLAVGLGLLGGYACQQQVGPYASTGCTGQSREKENVGKRRGIRGTTVNVASSASLTALPISVSVSHTCAPRLCLDLGPDASSNLLWVSQACSQPALAERHSKAAQRSIATTPRSIQHPGCTPVTSRYASSTLRGCRQEVCRIRM